MRLLIVYLCCLSSLLSLAQKPFVTLGIEPKEIVAGETITLSVRTNIQGSIDIDLPSVFVEGYDVMNGMEQQVDYTTGRIVTLVYRTQTGTISKAGTYKIGPASVKKGFKTYTSNSVSVKVLNNKSQNQPKENVSSRQLSQPGFGMIEKSKNSVYEGEALVLNAKVYARFNPTHLEDYASYSASGLLDEHGIGNTTRILVEEEHYKGADFYTFEYDKKVIFPSSSGNLIIDPFKLVLRSGFDGLPITSSKTNVQVKPLPAKAPLNFTGAVGKIELSQKISASNLKQGDVFTLVLDLKGHGNLHLLDPPKLNLPDAFALYGDPAVKEDFVFGLKGAEGKISYTFNIQVLESGNLSFPSTKLSFFDPDKGKYIELSTQTESITVKKTEQSATKQTVTAASSVNKKPSDEKVQNKAQFSASQTSQSITPWALWLAIALPLFLAMFLAFYFKKKQPESNLETEKTIRKEPLEFDAASHLLAVDIATGIIDDQQFYARLEAIIRQATAQKMGFESHAHLSKTAICHQLTQQAFPKQAIEQLQELLSICEEARYGFAFENNDRTKATEGTRQWIHQLALHNS